MNHQLAAKHEAVILATLGPPGRMIGGSKTGYRHEHPDHLPIFNANVCLGAGKVWWGDLDLTVDEEALADLASAAEEIVSVLYEHDGRFRHEDRPLIAEAVYSAAPSGHNLVDSIIAERRADGRLYARVQPRSPRWRRPNRPRLWRAWEVNAQVERSRNREGALTSRLLRFGGRHTQKASPLLVLGVHTFSREARGAWVEWTWYPGGHRAWAPALKGRVKLYNHRVRPYASVRLAPGVADELRMGIIIGPIDFLWG